MPTRPNVLLIVADDLRFDTIGALGADIDTPSLDALVEAGVAFTRHHNMGADTGAVCVPARAMLMSGHSLFRCEGPGGMTTAHPTLSERFGEAGYRTMATGKWHNGTQAFNRCFQEGEDVFFGGMGNHWNLPLCSRYPLDEYPEPAPARVDGGTGSVWSLDQPHDHYAPGTHSSRVFADAMRDFLTEHDDAGDAGDAEDDPDHAEDDRPFLGYVATTAPHDPRTAPGEYLDRYDPDDISLPPNFSPEAVSDSVDLTLRDEQLAERPLDPAAVRRHLADYHAIVSHLDAQVGRILARLDAIGERENTIVVFTADHGIAIGQHGLLGKQNVYDHSVRVPLIVAGPGVPDGERVAPLSCHYDLYPTLCDLADFSVPEGVEGESLVPVMAGERGEGEREADDPHRDALFLAYGDAQRGLRTDRFKLIDHYADGDRRTELFDLDADPAEMDDLADDPAHESTRRDLRATLDRRQHAADDPLVTAEE